MQRKCMEYNTLKYMP